MWWIELIKQGAADTQAASTAAIMQNQKQADFAPYMKMLQAGGGLAGVLLEALFSKKKDEAAAPVTPTPVTTEETEKPETTESVPDAEMLPQDAVPNEYRTSDIEKELSFNRWMQSVMNGTNYQSYTPTYAQDRAWG